MENIEPLPVKPVLTIVLITFQVGVHFFHDVAYDVTGINFTNIQNVAHPRKVYELALGKLPGSTSISFGICSFVPIVKESLGFPWARSIVSSVIHADDWHLYYNMLSFCIKGVQLENAYGPEKYCALILYSIFASHVLAVILAKVLSKLSIIAVINYGIHFDSGYESCAVGFSAVIFCLKYIVNFEDASITTMNLPIFGGFHRIPIINVPTKYAAWVELVVISLITPNASFVVIWLEYSRDCFGYALDTNSGVAMFLKSFYAKYPASSTYRRCPSFYAIKSLCPTGTSGSTSSPSQPSHEEGEGGERSVTNSDQVWYTEYK